MTSLRSRIALAVFLLAGSLGAILLWQVLAAQEEGAAAHQAAAEATVSDLLAEASRFAVVRSEYSDLQHLFERIRREGQVRTAAVADAEGRVVASTDGALLGKPLPPLRDGADTAWGTRELVSAAGRQGLLALEFSRTGLRRAREQAQRRGALVALGGASLLALLSVLLGTALTRRLTLLERASRRIGEGEYGARTGLQGRDEVSALGRTLDAVATRVQLSMEELGASREQYRLLLETLPHGVQETDVSGLITYSNRAHHRILGYPEGELVGKRIFELQATPEERGELERDLARLASERPRPAPYLTRSRRKDGSLVELQVDWDYRLDASGRLTGFISVITDVTERRRAEERISHLNRIYALLSGVNQAMVRFRDRQGLMDEICRVAVEVGQFRLAWIGLADRKANRVRIAARCGQVGEYLDRLELPLEGGPEAQGPTATAIRDSAPSFCNDIESDPHMAPWRDLALASGFRSSASLPIRVLGETIGALNLYSGDPGFFSAGEVRLLQDLAADVALAFEHREREAALRRSEERYRMVVENASEAIFIAQDGRLKFPNAALERLLERSAEEIGARPFTEFIHPDDRELVATRYRGRLAGEAPPSTYEFRVIAASGRTRWVQIGTVRIEWEGRPATLNFLSDVSERKGLEAQLLHAQKMEAVGRLAGGVAHDFNNLLAAIIGFGSAALAELPEGQPVRGDVEQMLAAAQRAAELTRSLLAFSRLQASNPQPISLDAVIARLEVLLRRVIGEDVELRSELGVPGTSVLADRGQVEQLLMNLATNARDAMPGGGRLTLSTRLARIDEEFIREHGYGRPGEYVLLAVGDTGVGMDEATRRRAFEPFFTTKEVGKGTGLGLAAVYGIVKQHGGYVTVDGAPGRGATVRIYLPLRDEAPQALEARAVDAEPARGSGETVLLAEDDAALRGLACRVLQAAGYRVVQARDGQEAIDLLEKQSGRIELLVVDVVMPRRSGREVVEVARRLRPEVKVLYTSGYPADTIQVKSVLEEGLSFLAKPAAPRDLLRKVREVLER